MIESENLGKQYEEKKILREVTLKIKKGEIFGLIGPSGAGKSTLLRLLDLLEEQSEGSLSIFGQEVTRDPAERLKLRLRMAMLFQKPVVFNTSVENNIALGLKFRKVGKSEIHEKVRDALDAIGLKEYGSRKAVTLSGGEAQRVALARAMVTEPEILYLDEPTANLDPPSTEKIEQLVFEMHREFGTTIIISTHDMLQGQRLSHRIGVIMGGELQQVGTTREIFYRPSNRTIAQFVGMENLLPGTVISSDRQEVMIDVGGNMIAAISDALPGKKVLACFRAEDVTIDLSPRTSTSARNVFRGTISRLIPVGPFVNVMINCGFPVTSLVTLRTVEDLHLIPKMEVWVSFKATAIQVLKS